jgi:acetyl-CoA acyltransferase
MMSGTAYNDYMAVDLARFALKGLMVKTALDPKLVDYILMGTVIQEPRTSNIAREAAMGAGLPISCPSSTVTQACISANQAITTGAEKILAGEADIVIAGGAETASDVPIRYQRSIRKRLMQVPKTMKKGPLAVAKLFGGLGLKDLAPEAPSIANFTTGEVMVSVFTLVCFLFCFFVFVFRICYLLYVFFHSFSQMFSHVFSSFLLSSFPTIVTGNQF